jgi:recombinational DNA repair ATPase RecF
MAKKTNDDTVLHYLKAVIKNFKNIEAKVVQIDGRSLAIIGGNNQGKSSLIQTLKMIASSKEIPPVPIKEGEERAEIEVTIGGTVGGKREEYRIEAYFTPGNQKGALRIYDKDGNKEDKSVRTKLDSLIKASSFSIDDFLRSPASNRPRS